MDEAVKPFVIPSFSVQIDQLKRKLQDPLYPSPSFENEKGGIDDYGLTTETVRDYAQYYKEDYSFDRWRRNLEQFPHFVTTINSIDLHFIHLSNPNGRYPLLLLHGWPGSFQEFLPCLEKLKAEYSIVVPSLPGFGFSSAPTSKRFGVGQVADTMNKLMSRLGYERYVVQGGDWGSIIATWLGIYYSEHCELIYLNMAPAIPSLYKPFHWIRYVAGLFLDPKWTTRLGLLSNRDAILMKRMKQYLCEESGYMLIQGTKPDTITFGLVDSPVGMMAWILEKFWLWGGPDSKTIPFRKDQVLDHVTLYWVTGSMGSSMRLYKEFFSCFELPKLLFQYCPTPTAVLACRGDIFFAPPFVLSDRFNLISYRYSPDMGHFPALENPTLFTRHIEAVLDQSDWKRRHVSTISWWISLGPIVFFWIPIFCILFAYAIQYLVA